MSQENVSLVKRFWEHYLTAGEMPWDMVHESGEVHDHDAPDQGVYRGHAGVARWLRDWGAAWSEWSSEPEQFIDADDSVVVVVRMKAKGAGSGLELDRQDAQVYRFRDNKIVRLDYCGAKDCAASLGRLLPTRQSRVVHVLLMYAPWIVASYLATSVAWSVLTEPGNGGPYCTVVHEPVDGSLEASSLQSNDQT